MLIYIHGFNSSPQSGKAQACISHLRRQQVSCLAPALAADPARAIAGLRCLCEAAGRRALLAGSSLGGFYATWLVENGLAPKAVLINPAVAAERKLADEVGRKQRNWHTGAEYLFSRDYLQALRDLAVERISDPRRYLLMVQTGDELLDWREADRYYRDCEKVIEEGGDHGFAGFERHLPAICALALAAGGGVH